MLTFVLYVIDPRDMVCGGYLGPTKMCPSGIQNLLGGLSNQLNLGNLFLMNVYLATNMEENSVTLAKHF